jgi:hypothetical protein
MKSILTFSQFITEEAEGITPEQKKKLDDAAAAFAKQMEAELLAKAPAQAATTPVSTAPAPVRTVPTVTDYNAAIGQFDELPLKNKTMDTTAAKAWLILTRDKLKTPGSSGSSGTSGSAGTAGSSGTAGKPTDYTTGIKILKDNFLNAEPFAQKMLATCFIYPVEFLQQQSTTIAGSKYTGVDLQAEKYTLGTTGKSANYRIDFINPSLQAQAKPAKPAAGTVISVEGRSPDMSTATDIANFNWRTQTGQDNEGTTTKAFKNTDGSITVTITGTVK